MFLERRDEDEQRRGDFHHALYNRKTVEAGHLDVEENQVRFLRLDRADRLAAILAGVDDLDVLEGFEAQLETLDGELFVVDENGADGHVVWGAFGGRGEGTTAGGAEGFCDSACAGAARASLNAG